MIEVGNIVTLDNNKDYLLVQEINRDGSRYLFAIHVLEDDSLTSESDVFEAIVKEDGEYLKEVEEGELKASLLSEFEDKCIEIIENAEIPA